MGFVFQIRPVSLEKGFTLSCDGILEHQRSYRRLIEALRDAILLGRALEGEVRIFDVEGRIADILPLPVRANEHRDNLFLLQECGNNASASASNKITATAAMIHPDQPREARPPDPNSACTNFS